MNEIKRFLSHILERRNLVKVINKRESVFEKKKNQRKLRIKEVRNKDFLKRNQNYCK